jgi:hypothetical protein
MKKTMLNRLFLPILFVCFIFSANAQTWKTFSNDSILFTAKYPGDWISKIKENKRVFFTSPSENKDDDFLENINIGVVINPEFGTSIKIAGAVPKIIESLKTSMTDLVLESQRNFTWNGGDAVEIVYTAYHNSDPSLHLRFIQRYCFYKTRLYTATYTSAKRNVIYRETALKILDSIKFKP